MNVQKWFNASIFMCCMLSVTPALCWDGEEVRTIAHSNKVVQLSKSLCKMQQKEQEKQRAQKMKVLTQSKKWTVKHNNGTY